MNCGENYDELQAFRAGTPDDSLAGHKMNGVDVRSHAAPGDRAEIPASGAVT